MKEEREREKERERERENEYDQKKMEEWKETTQETQLYTAVHNFFSPQKIFCSKKDKKYIRLVIVLTKFFPLFKLLIRMLAAAVTIIINCLVVYIQKKKYVYSSSTHCTYRERNRRRHSVLCICPYGTKDDVGGDA